MSNPRPAKDDLQSLANQISLTLDADIILYHGEIDAGCDQIFRSLINNRKSCNNVALFITTTGGLADEAYRLARYCQENYKRFFVFVSHYCKSAGTLISIGADEIVLSDMAELGPLDVQIAKHDEVVGYVSGLTPVQALITLREETFATFQEFFLNLLNRSYGQISTRSAAQIASRLTIGCFSHIYKQIDPMRLGEYQRALNIAHEYGAKLDRGNLQLGALISLVSGYPSHGFVIDRKEASSLFKNVRPPTVSEQKLAIEFRKLVRFFRERQLQTDKETETVIEFIAPNAKIDSNGSIGRDNSARQNSKPKRSSAGKSAPRSQPNKQDVDGKNSRQLIPTIASPNGNGKAKPKNMGRSGRGN